MVKKLVLVAVFLVLAAMTMAAAACGSSPTATVTTTTTPPSTEAAIRAYADPATTTTLQGLSEDDLAKYTQYADAQFKAAITKAVLDQTYNQVTAALGTFQSIAFLATEKQDAYIIVHYRATYSKGQTGVRMVFDSDHLVAGQWFE